MGFLIHKESHVKIRAKSSCRACTCGQHVMLPGIAFGNCFSALQAMR